MVDLKKNNKISKRSVVAKPIKDFKKDLNDTILTILDATKALGRSVVYIVTEISSDFSNNEEKFSANLIPLNFFTEDMRKNLGFSTTVCKYIIKKDLKNLIEKQKIYECGPKGLCEKIVQLGIGFDKYLKEYVSEADKELYRNSYKEAFRLIKIFNG